MTSSVSPKWVVVLASVLCWTMTMSVPRPAHAAEPVDTEFPYAIQTELGASEYAAGDHITITSLRGNRQHLEPGGRYLLEGTYELASADKADLAWFATSRGPEGSTPVSNDEHVLIFKGSGKFRLEKTLQGDGWLHVSFYADGHSHGGVYFGERGVDQTVLRRKSWSDFAVQPRTESVLSEPANLAILTYLGKPVPPPANLDSKYSTKALLAAFMAVTEKKGLRVKHLAVDTSEFPFLVYGALVGKQDYREFERGLRESKDYSYAGSVVGTTDKESTYFSLNMTPQNQIPPDQMSACNRRLMVRLQMLADAAQQKE